MAESTPKRRKIMHTMNRISDRFSSIPDRRYVDETSDDIPPQFKHVLANLDQVVPIRTMRSPILTPSESSGLQTLFLSRYSKILRVTCHVKMSATCAW